MNNNTTINTTKLVTVICWLVSAAVIIGFVVWAIFNTTIAISSSWSWNTSGNMEYLATHTRSASGINRLEIDWVAGPVIITLHDGDEIIMTEYANPRIRDNEHVHIVTNGSTLRLEFVRGRVRNNTPSKRIEVQIPSSMVLESIDVRTISGNVDVNGVDASDVVLRTTSGRINVRDMEASTVNLRTVSGNIDINRVEANTLTTNTTSGRHELRGTFGRIESRSISGRIEITSQIVPDRIEARATSGRITVTVPNDGDAIHVSHSTTSGRFESEIPTITGGGGTPQFELRTVSGRIEINALR